MVWWTGLNLELAWYLLYQMVTVKNSGDVEVELQLFLLLSFLTKKKKKICKQKMPKLFLHHSSK